jgi:hypothetical protein
MSEPQYFLFLNGEIVGPYAVESVNAFFQEGIISLETPCCLNGSEEWGKCGDILQNVTTDGVEPSPTPEVSETKSLLKTQTKTKLSLKWVAVIGSVVLLLIAGVGFYLKKQQDQKLAYEKRVLEYKYDARFRGAYFALIFETRAYLADGWEKPALVYLNMDKDNGTTKYTEKLNDAFLRDLKRLDEQASKSEYSEAMKRFENPPPECQEIHNALLMVYSCYLDMVQLEENEETFLNWHSLCTELIKNGRKQVEKLQKEIGELPPRESEAGKAEQIEMKKSREQLENAFRR